MTYGQDSFSDATSRCGKPRFVWCPNEKTLLIPDWPGNNRIDSLKNILCHQGIGLVFLIPGIKETLRVNGLAEIIIDPELQNRFLEQERLPISVIKVDIHEIYLHCSKALIRSALWDADSIQHRSVLPSMGKMLKEQTGDPGTIETQEEMEARFSKELY